MYLDALIKMQPIIFFVPPKLGELEIIQEYLSSYILHIHEGIMPIPLLSMKQLDLIMTTDTHAMIHYISPMTAQKIEQQFALYKYSNYSLIRSTFIEENASKTKKKKIMIEEWKIILTSNSNTDTISLKQLHGNSYSATYYLTTQNMLWRFIYSLFALPVLYKVSPEFMMFQHEEGNLIHYISWIEPYSPPVNRVLLNKTNIDPLDLFEVRNAMFDLLKIKVHNIKHHYVMLPPSIPLITYSILAGIPFLRGHMVYQDLTFDNAVWGKKAKVGGE